MEVDAHHEAQQLTYAFLGLLVLEGGAARLSDYLHYRPGDVDWDTAQANVRTIFALFAEHGIVTLSDEPDPLVELTDSGYRQFVVAEGLLAQRN